MKKTYQVLIGAVAVILCLALGGALLYYEVLFDPFKPSINLTDALEENMSMREISVKYESASVAVLAETKYKISSSSVNTYLGSAVCVASIGYKTQSGYEVSNGSYFVTNYHTIREALDPDYSDMFSVDIYITTDDGNYNLYPTSILWASRELDMAILFCGEQVDGLNYVRMKDRTIDCDQSQKLKRDDVFTLGTPLDLTFMNTYAEGYISNSKTMISPNLKEFYYNGSAGSVKGTSNKFASTARYYETEVLENLYEDLIMMNLDITNGNSGGGLFDSKGNLVGLTTLGLSVDSTNGSAMNFAVPIYPATILLDKLIENNENGGNNAIYTLRKLGLSVYDSETALTALEIQAETKSPFYYIEGNVLQTNEKSKLEFDKSGVYVYSNNMSSPFSMIGSGCLITSMQNSLGTFEIKDRNDMIFFLLNCKSGEEISVTYNKNLITSSQTLAKITLA